MNTIFLNLPKTSYSVECAGDTRFVFQFPVGETEVSRSGDDLVFVLENGVSITLSDFYVSYTAQNMPVFEVEGAEVAGTDFLAALGQPELMPAAGPEPANDSHYQEWSNMDLLGGLDRLGGIDIGWKDGGRIDREDGGAGGNAERASEELNVFLSVSASGTENDIREVTFTVSLDRVSLGDVTVTLSNGHTLTIPAGEISASVTIPTRADDVYLQGGDVYSAAIKDVSSSFALDTPQWDGSSVSSSVADDADATVFNIRAVDTDEAAAKVHFIIEAANAPQTDAVVTVNVGGVDYAVNFAAGQTSATLEVANPNAEDVYKDGSSVTATVTGVTGGNYEAVQTGASATASVTDTTDATIISIEAVDGVEGDGTVTFKVQASNAPQGEASVQVSIGERVYDVALNAAGEGTLTVAHGNAEDVYKDVSSVTATVTGVTGGNYEAVQTGASATASVIDTIDTTTFTLIASPADIEGNVTFTVTADHAPHSADTVTVFVQVQGESQTREVSIDADGKGSFTVAIGEDGTVSASITEVQHSKYEDVEFSEEAASVTAVTLDGMNFATQDKDVRSSGFDFDAQALASGVTLTQEAVDAVNASIDFGTFSLADGKLVFTQNKAYSHAEGADSATLGPVSFNATDANGNAALLNVTVAITDDGPAIRGLDAVSVHAGRTASDTFSIDFGADGGDGAEVSFSVGDTVLEQKGEGVWSADLGDGQSITVTQGEGGEFSYSLSYDSSTAGAGFGHELTVQVTDADKDAVSQTVTIAVRNDAPTASSDVLHIGKEAQGGTSTSAGVVITLDKNSDGATCVVSVLGEKSGSKISYDGSKPSNVEASVVYGDKNITDDDIDA
ncbi:MAG: hypothetical protein IJB29_03360, partial [Mailhella sp.]|nr:hypothetical protein [Mailhella sp.]